MTLFQTIPPRALRDNRDHIIVITHDQQITTLRLREILQVTPHHKSGHAVVHSRNASGTSVTLIQEVAQLFLQRCENLLEALKLEDCVLINQHYCPKRQAS